MHSFAHPTDKVESSWLKNFLAGHQLEDSNDFLSTQENTKTVQDINQREILDYLIVRESMYFKSLY